MLTSVKNFLGIAPQSQQECEVENAFVPSRLAMKLANPDKTYFRKAIYDKQYKGEKKILVLCTEEQYMTMTNGAILSTGNQPVEISIPLLHLQDAGFAFDVCTPTGKPVPIIDYEMPRNDDAIRDFFTSHGAAFQKPLSLEVLVKGLLDDDNHNTPSSYVAVFIPGGHGSIIGLPGNENVSRLIRWAVRNDKHLVAICHGPGVLLAADKGDDGDFVLGGYAMALYPDKMDKFILPLLGYLPGSMPWYCGEALTAAGVNVVNQTASGYVHKDRKVITGDSPDAAQPLGIVAAKSLLSALMDETKIR